MTALAEPMTSSTEALSLFDQHARHKAAFASQHDHSSQAACVQGGNTMYELEIELEDPEPRIWRRIVIASGYSVAALHYAIICTLGAHSLPSVQQKFPPISACIKPARVGACEQLCEYSGSSVWADIMAFKQPFTARHHVIQNCSLFCDCFCAYDRHPARPALCSCPHTLFKKHMMQAPSLQILSSATGGIQGWYCVHRLDWNS